MIRVLAPEGSLVPGAEILLAPDEVRHLQVRRIAGTTEVMALDGAGSAAEGRLIQAGKEWRLQVITVDHAAAPPDLLLAVGAGDRDRFQMVVEKGAELGVTRIIPLESERARQVATRLRDVGKLRRQALEACKQSGNRWAPQIDEPLLLAAFLADPPDARWLLADQHGSATPSFEAAQNVGWVIGPEGGLTVDEFLRVEAVLRPERVSFGAHILRFETAAIAAAVLTHDRRHA